MKIISGFASQTLSNEIAIDFNTIPTYIEYSKFPDKELYLKIEDEIDNEDVLIIQSICSNSDFISLLQLIDACENSKKIFVFIPYMGYSRQNTNFKIGEPISSRIIAKSINCDKIFTVNIHNEQILDYFNCKIKNLDASPLIAKYINQENHQKNDDLLIISPDKGSSKLAKNVSSYLNCSFEVFNKIRYNSYSISIENKIIHDYKKNVIIVDDIISTGNTITETMKLLSNNNYVNVSCVCVHPVLAGNSILKMYSSGIKKIAATNTIEKIQSKISVHSLISDEFII